MKITIESINTLFNKMGFPDTPSENVDDCLEYFNDRIGWELSELRNDITTLEIYTDNEIIMVHELVNR